jgi:hypothetical protein
VADVALHGPVDNHELHVALDEGNFFAVFPMKGDHAARLIGTVESGPDEQQNLRWEDLRGDAVKKMDVTVQRVNWFSTYRVHHRVAKHFRRGRAFLVGDAAHIHSPVGGQGMNTGIGDAVNLAWKLAEAIRGGRTALLDSYEPERRAFAERLVATTDRAFTVATRDGMIARAVRLKVLPAVLPSATSAPTVRRLLFRTVSQIMISYRKSSLSRGNAGAVCGGDRLPWVAPQDEGAYSGRAPSESEGDNFTPLRSIDWQVHVYGTALAPLKEAAARHRIPLHAFPWGPAASRAGLARDAAYLVRPDGYIALADSGASPGVLEGYVANLGH